MTLVATSAKASGSGGGGALTLITDTTLGADGTLTFSAIPGTYNHLMAIGYVRLTNASLLDNLMVRFNNDSGANHYYSQAVTGSAATSSGGEEINATQASLARVPAANATASWWGGFHFTIPNYASTTAFKNAVGTTYGPGDATTGDQLVRATGILFISTAAITQIDLYGLTTANLKTGSRVSLYGIT